jgi:hypothetical protein
MRKTTWKGMIGAFIDKAADVQTVRQAGCCSASVGPGVSPSVLELLDILGTVW